MTESDIRNLIASSGGGSGLSLVSLGTGNGSDLSFNFSRSSVACITVFVNSILQANSSWSVSAGTGPAGVDRLVFGAGNAPPNLASIEALIS